MSSEIIHLKAGARDSRLSLIQSQNLITEIEKKFPFIEIELVPMSSPGDKDKKTDLREAADDFFTKFLDDALRDGQIDFALHSAKDLPYPQPEDLDWCWFPWREDPSDSIVMRLGETLADLPKNPKIGISSDRREEWALEKLDNPQLVPIRGTIEERITQLDNGNYDMVIIATAALNRLKLTERITELIPLHELEVPEAQGILAATFLKGNETLTTLRKYFAGTVNFVGGGPGDVGYFTLQGQEIMGQADVCLYDALSPEALLHFLPPHAEQVFVGKRGGKHYMPMAEICERMATYSRQGKQVVRLKGGDPGIFGRLQEEVDAVENYKLPYLVTPGVSSMSAAATVTGFTLTRRDVSRGFTVITPRKSCTGTAPIGIEERQKLPMVFFMGIQKLEEIHKELTDEGWLGTTPAAVIMGGSTPNEVILTGTLETIAKVVKDHGNTQPGICIVGDTADARYLFKSCNLPLERKRIMITGSQDVQQISRNLGHLYGAKVINMPYIQSMPCPDVIPFLQDLNQYDWIILTSPTAVRMLFEAMPHAGIDSRDLPDIVTTGPGINRVLEEFGLRADITPTENFGSDGLLELLKGFDVEGCSALRLHSTQAPAKLSAGLAELGVEVEDALLYDTFPLQNYNIPDFDYIFFSSGSCVRSFLDQHGAEALEGKMVLSIGTPTTKVLHSYGIEKIIQANEATTADAFDTLAIEMISDELLGL